MKPHEITNIKRVRIWDALKGPIDRLIYTGVTEEEIETFVKFCFEQRATWFNTEEELLKRCRS